MKRLLIILALLIASEHLWAQNIIELSCKDAKTGHEIADVFIAAKGELYQTNKDGKLEIAADQLPIKIITSHIAYKSQAFLVSGDTTLYLSAKASYLDEVEVRAFEQIKPILQQDAAISYIDARELNSFGEQHFVHAVNTMPGIQMEERAPLSYRISIRGSSIRSPFGVRNVKIYWNDLPFTEPNGVTPLNLLDFSNISEMEVIKGPAGSLYGAGTGGVMLLRSSNPGQEDYKAYAGLMVGSFGLSRSDIAFNHQMERTATHLGLSYQQTEGYREHSASERFTAQAKHQFSYSEQSDITFMALLSAIDYQIPGGLTAEQFEENPKAARPATPFAAGSAEQNAGVEQNSLYLGIVNTHLFSSKWSNKTSLFTNFTQFENPFITDYKRDRGATWGGRTVFYYTKELNSSKINWTNGMEYSQNRTHARNFGNRSGDADTLRFEDRLNVLNAFAFSQADWQWDNDWRITAALSLNFLYYEIDRLQDFILGSPSFFANSFSPQLIPRIAFWKGFGNEWGLHASISSGFSPPTLTEVRTNEGSINRNLQAERGINYESGFRWFSKSRKFLLDATFFHFRLNETITTRTNEEGVVLFLNAGSTSQWGTEVMTRINWIEKRSFIESLHSNFSYTGHFFNFKELQRNGEDFSGNQLPGVSPHFISSSLNLQAMKGLYAVFTYQFSDAIPLNDANSVYADPYHHAHLRISYKHLWKGKYEVELYSGVDNLFNQTYSLGNDLNAFGGRYFQAAPERNYYLGVKFRWY